MVSLRSGPFSGHRRVTAAEVAAQAGVSTATVSLVVNGKTAGRVSAEIISRVESAIQALGYIVDGAGSSLATGSGNFVILVAPDISNAFYSQVITGVRSAIGPGYQLLLSVTDDGQFPDVQDVRKLFALRPAGVLVDAPNERFLAELAVEAPLVLLDAPGIDGAAPMVNFDVESGSVELIDHLAAQGHRKVAYLDSVTGTLTFQWRRAALGRRAAELGVELVDGLIAATTIDLGSAAGAFLQAWPELAAADATAVLCATDTQAYGVLQAARVLGLTVPDDVAVTGFDDLPFSASSDPSLTTVRLPAAALGASAGAQLKTLMEGKQPEQHEISLASELVVRQSTRSNSFNQSSSFSRGIPLSP